MKFFKTFLLTYAGMLVVTYGVEVFVNVSWFPWEGLMTGPPSGRLWFLYLHVVVVGFFSLLCAMLIDVLKD